MTGAGCTWSRQGRRRGSREHWSELEVCTTAAEEASLMGRPRRRCGMADIDGCDATARLAWEQVIGRAWWRLERGRRIASRPQQLWARMKKRLPSPEPPQRERYVRELILARPCPMQKQQPWGIASTRIQIGEGRTFAYAWRGKVGAEHSYVHNLQND